jgi:hypothetical protein
MKKVLALVLAVIMVCTMAMAVTTSGTIYSSTTPSSEAGYELKDGDPALVPGGSIFFEVTDLFTNGYYTQTVKYNSNEYQKFVPENNKVTVSFSRGTDLVASQGWVRIKNDQHEEGAPLTIDDYRYVVTLKNSDTKVADGKADIAFSKITAKATGKLIKEFTPETGKHYVVVDGTNLIWDVGYADGGKVVITGTTKAPAFALDQDQNRVPSTIYTVKEGSADNDGAALKTGYYTSSGVAGTRTFSGKIAFNAGATYCVTEKAYPTTTDVAKLLKKNKLISDESLAIGGKVIAYNYIGSNEINGLSVVYTLTDAKATFNAYSIAADGTVAKLNATLDDGVMTFSAPAKFVVVVDGTMATTASGTSTGTGNTTNPGTGANDVVGVAAALAVVALVSGAAISLKK